MTRDIDDAAALAGLTGAVFAAGQAGMARLRQQEATLRDRLDGLEARKRAALAALQGDGPALAAGVDVLFHDWVNSRAEALQRELARCLAQQAQARATLVRAFGRSQAATSLYDAAVLAQTRDRTRREDRG